MSDPVLVQRPEAGLARGVWEAPPWFFLAAAAVVVVLFAVGWRKRWRIKR